MTRRKPTLAEIFHTAADKYLSPSTSFWKYSNKHRYSCTAIANAAMDMSGESRVLISAFSIGPDCERVCTLDIHNWTKKAKEGRPLTYAALKFAKECGVKTGSSTQFGKFKGKDVQSVRYAWLKLLAQVAEEEGL